MVGETGFEPATLCSQSRCATRLRYSPTATPIKETALSSNRHSIKVPILLESGGPGGIRTPNLAVMSGRLYR